MHRLADVSVSLLFTALSLTATTVAAQTIEPYTAQSVEPYKPKASTPVPRAEERTTRTSNDSCPPRKDGNLVEPLSNGLRLSASLNDIREQFDDGQASWDSRTLTYRNFRVAVGGAEEKIWHFHITAPGVCLNSGIHYGSTRADVKSVFGSTYGTTHGQYKLTFEYDGDRLVDIGIDPAEGDFVPYKRKSSGSTPAPSRPQTSPSILGKWWGVQSTTQIDINADGTYSSPNGAKGTWRMSGDEIVFTGALAGWNRGRAKLTKGGWIEFLWKDESGAAYLFQLIRR